MPGGAPWRNECSRQDLSTGKGEARLSELVVMGFSDRYRAEEVLGQLRRLEFSWAADFENAVAAEVDFRGQLSFRHSQAVDPAFGDSAPAWRALLGAIQPPATPLRSGAMESA